VHPRATGARPGGDRLSRLQADARPDAAQARTVLFGAFDRHNLGDMLFAHLAPELVGRCKAPVIAGLVAADLRGYGGHRVRSLTELLSSEPGCPLHVVHAGGEILSCDRWAARITTLESVPARQAVARFDRDAVARDAWLDTQPGFVSPAPYVVRRRDLPAGSRVAFRAVGGVGLSALGAAHRQYVFEALSEADRVSVRDRLTLETIAAEGIPALLEADPVSRICEVLGSVILGRGLAVPRGCLAIQIGAEFADDASIVSLAEQIEHVVRRFDLPVVLFRAGAAPWHDDIDVLRRLAVLLKGLPVSVFESLDIRDICALIASARAVLASSLHVRIVAESFGRPAVSLLGRDRSATGQAAKVSEYVSTWYSNARNLAGLTEVAARLAEVLAAGFVQSRPGYGLA